MVTDDAVESFAQVMAQRGIQAEREARQREKEMEKLKEEREARLEQARKEQVELLMKIEEQAKKTNGATRIGWHPLQNERLILVGNARGSVFCVVNV